MSTRTSFEAEVKKISSWVRPGVREVRASACRPVSALIRLDLPTLDRPANAISTPRMGGSAASDPAAAANCHSRAKSLRPASISAEVRGEAGVSASASGSFTTRSPLRLRLLFEEQALQSFPSAVDQALQTAGRALEIVPQLDLS